MWPRLALRALTVRCDPASASRWGTRRISVEVDRLDQIPQALAGGADTIMLDNFSWTTPAGEWFDRRACDRGGQRHHDIGTGSLGRGHGRGRRDLRKLL